ncbi:MAG: hypothetical protein H0V00_07905 [Chloroflexia bacterium]|nr:hypothetical protein [Chloroflexia bacterium]
MLRFSRIVSVLVLLLLLLPTAAATAQESSPAASPSASQPLDLAAMTLVPSDFDIPGIGRWFGESKSLDQDVAEQAQFGGKDPDVARETMVTAGWQREYTSRLDAPVEYGAEEAVRSLAVRTYVREFADAAGAASAFTFLEDESAAPAPSSGATPVAGGVSLSEDIPGTQVIGDESEITRHLGIVSSTGLPYNALDLTFQVDNLVAGVELSDYTGGEPEVAEVEALAQTYLERIEQVKAEGGPGLSTQIVRLDAPDIVGTRDEYGRLGGVQAPDYNESAETFAARGGRADASTDYYTVSQRLPAGSDATGDDVSYGSFIYRFADDAAAADWLNKDEERLAGIAAFVEFTAMPDATTFGDESRTYAIDRLSGEQVTSGYLIYARVGNDVVDLRVFAKPEAPLAVAEELAQAQVACLESEGVCERIAAPASLAALAVPATPVVATPVS